MHTLHGRSLAVATGVKLANHELKVICTGGDGDGYGIGGNHFLHTMRRNVDLTYIVMDNQIYGLTTGQVSPTSVKGMKTKSTPYGNVENPINPIPMAIVGGATYVARAFSGKQKHMVEMIKGAIQHKGFALVDVFSPCVTYNQDNTYQWFNPRVKMLEEQGHDPTDLHKAIDRGYQWGDEIPIGLFWRRTDLPSLEELEPVLHTGEGPLAFRKLGIPKSRRKRWLTSYCNLVAMEARIVTEALLAIFPADAARKGTANTTTSSLLRPRRSADTPRSPTK